MLLNRYFPLLSYHIPCHLRLQNIGYRSRDILKTIPGAQVNPENPDPMRHPKLVSPAVLLLCDDDAPTNKTVHAGNGKFSCSATYINEPLDFSADVTYEDLLERKSELFDMSNTREMSGLLRVQKMLSEQKNPNNSN